jgi:hypothetical protein
MSPLAVSGIVFAIVIAGALFGLLVGIRLLQHHLSPDSKDVIKLAMGVLGTMTALVLGLLIASAKGSYNVEHNGVSQLAANVLVLDHTLAESSRFPAGMASGRAGRWRRLISAPVGKDRRASV